MNSDNHQIKQIIKNQANDFGIDEISFGAVKNDSITVGASAQFDPGRYKSVICAALSYNYETNRIPSSTPGYIARYTTSNFYKILSSKLKSLGKFIKSAYAPEKSNKEFFSVFVNSKLNDKAIARKYGLGHMARNSLVMLNGYGTSAVIGELFIDMELSQDAPLKEKQTQCSDCNICVKSCPTGALSGHGIIKKEICLQHLTTSLELPVKINDKFFVDLWGSRFYGCTKCVDVCPENKIVKQGSISEMTGFIGNTFNIERILDMKKDDYKKYFSHNQLSAGWVHSVCHIRNALISAFNQKNIPLIREYAAKINLFDWNDNEKDYILGFIKTFLA